MKNLRRLLVRTLVACVGAGFALLAFRADRPLVAEVTLLVVGGLVLEALVRSSVEPQPPYRRFGRARPRRAPARPDELVRLENQVVLAASAAGDLHFRLRPVLREIAEERGEAAGLAGLGEVTAGAAWELIRPDRPPPANSFARGLSATELSAVVDAIEAIS